MLKSLFDKSKKLFINIIDEFGLVYKNGSYCLKNYNNPSCHLLEMALINNYKFSGEKIKDLCCVLSTNSRWVLGFYHGYKNVNVKFSNKEYVVGHHLGVKMRNIVDNYKEEVNI